ncbi:MAG: 30S ribosomal protein S9 [Flavobacteriaceae bacterium]|nr:30S ribosomal protein S9 [Flavobacteriaceae bacterium]MCY4267175.1 30S ribosomal protein S9 [Flavobacteriaceae bacterium]MCY4298560.1 30S ribosomal protein S9 [Flavobacteriaceae bacterium]
MSTSHHAVGRRKTSVARVYLTQGTGKLTVNKNDYKEYFPTLSLQHKLNQPFIITNTIGDYNVSISVQGGGVNGQAEAIRLAIAKALCLENIEHRLSLKPEGLLTRDARMVERKKFGQKKARKKFQFSKR